MQGIVRSQIVSEGCSWPDFFRLRKFRETLLRLKLMCLRSDVPSLNYPASNGEICVLYGSVAWSLYLGTNVHNWRSDLDVTTNERVGEDHMLQYDIGGIFGLKYGKGDRFNDDAFRVWHHMVEILVTEGSHQNYSDPQLSPSTRDHFRLLSRKLKGPWQTFFQGMIRMYGRKRVEDICSYVTSIESKWLWATIYFPTRR